MSLQCVRKIAYISDIINVNNLSLQKESISKRIREAILSGEKGRIYFVKDFADYKNDALVTKVLYRLEKNKILIRLAKGIYLYPVVTCYGIYYPSLDYIAKSIAKRDKAKVMPTGSAALNLLGISTQVPMNAVYLTTGSSRVIKIGKRKITFKRSAPKNLEYEGTLFPLVVIVMKELGEKNIDAPIMKQIEKILLKIDKQATLSHDIALAPFWIRSLLLPIIRDKIISV